MSGFKADLSLQQPSGNHFQNKRCMNFNVFFANYVIKQYTVHVHSMLASFCYRSKLSAVVC